MKIAFVTVMTGSPWGGSEILWSMAAERALDEGHQVLISVFNWTASHPVIQRLQQKGAVIHTRRRWYFSPVTDMLFNRLALELYERKWWPAPYRQLKDFQPNVVCISQGGSIDVVYDGIQRYINESGKPYVLISQMNFEHKMLQLRIIPSLQRIYSKAKRQLFVSERNKEVLERQICMPLNNASVIANPANTSSRGAMPYPSFTDDIVHFACVGRLECEAKGQDILLQVLSQPVWKARKWHLHLYGDGADEAYLRMLTTAYGLDNKVTFHGHVSDIASVWEKCHILLMPSLREGTPLALIEAMSCGRPSVVTDVAGNDVYCREGETGFLAEAPNVKYFNRAMERAWAARGDWEEMGLAAFAHFDKNTDKNPDLTLLNYLLNTH